jgi:hypothetical protein
MQTTPTDRPDGLPPVVSSMLQRFDPFKLLLVLVIALAALIVWSEVRQRVVAPFDELATESQCADHGEDIGREPAGYERSNRFGLFNRSVGFCFYEEGAEGEPPLTVSIADTEPGPLYRGAKFAGIIIQLGLVSIFLRLVVDPILDTYRQIRERFFDG